jgi:hypothetical protein
MRSKFVCGHSRSIIYKGRKEKKKEGKKIKNKNKKNKIKLFPKLFLDCCQDTSRSADQQISRSVDQ